jgi:hypothetical protein
MRKSTLRRLDALEKEERLWLEQMKRKDEVELCFAWTIVLAYYLGDLNPNGDPLEAKARALNYQDGDDYDQALAKEDVEQIIRRHQDAYRRLFAQVGLDYDSASVTVLSEAFVKLVDQLPDEWMEWLRSKLHEWCSPFEAPNKFPLRFSRPNLILFYGTLPPRLGI